MEKINKRRKARRAVEKYTINDVQVDEKIEFFILSSFQKDERLAVSVPIMNNGETIELSKTIMGLAENLSLISIGDSSERREEFAYLQEAEFGELLELFLEEEYSNAATLAAILLQRVWRLAPEVLEKGIKGANIRISIL